MKLEILNAQGKTLRTYASTDPVRTPDPATDPVAYNKLCQQTPTAPDCGLPLYWPAPPQVLRTTAGMHRFSWDMHYDPIPGGAGGGRGGGGGAVPHRTYPAVASPWVAPGSYTVRLTANGKTLTQPITVKMDPRVKVTPEVQRIFTLTAQMEANARIAADAYKQARELTAKLKARPQSAANDALIKQLEDIAPEETGNLASIGSQMVASVMGMQGSELPPTAAALEACAQQEASYTALMTKWSALKAKVNGPAPAR